MSDDNIQPGKIRRLESAYEGRLERFLEYGLDEVWAMLTEPRALAQWLAPGTIDLRLGGNIHLDFADSGIVIDSTIREFDPPRLIEYSWSSGDEPQRPLRWELSPAAKETRLVLTVRLPADEDIARACAGFDAHLEMLAAALEGVPMRFPVDLFLEARRVYQALKPE